MNEIEFYLEDLKSKFSKIDFNNYYLSYSGGRDSHFLYWFIKEYLKDDKIQIFTVNTTFEHTEITRRMIKHADIIYYPSKEDLELLKTQGSPAFGKKHNETIDRYQRGLRSPFHMSKVLGTLKNPNTGKRSSFCLRKDLVAPLLNNELPRISNNCCKLIKHKAIKRYEKQSNKLAIIGVRTEESQQRKFAYKSCFSKTMVFHPIFDLTDNLLLAIEEKYSIPIPDVYQICKSTGCAGCGNAFKETIELELSIMTANQRDRMWALFGDIYRYKGVE